MIKLEIFFLTAQKTIADSHQLKDLHDDLVALYYQGLAVKVNDQDKRHAEIIQCA